MGCAPSGRAGACGPADAAQPGCTAPAPAAVALGAGEAEASGRGAEAARPSAGLAAGALEPRSLAEAERTAACRAANFFAASAEHARPIALWILGPSSVGKSTLTADVGTEFDIPPSPSDGTQVEDARRGLDAVVVDGEFMRDAHGVWQRWIRTDQWRSAYPALKTIINEEKDRLEEAAVAERKHLVIPQTMLNLGKGLASLARLVGKGYTNHVLAVVAPLEECQRRGQVREVSTGKRYQPSEFERSIQAIPPMVAACNGRYQLIRALEQNEGSKKNMGYRLLAAGPCGGGLAEGELNTPAPDFDPDFLSRVINENIRAEVLC